MSEEQFAALLARLKDDAGLQEKFKSAADLDAAMAIAKGAGFDVSKADWFKYQAKKTTQVELSDQELESVAGGADCPNCTQATKDSYVAWGTGRVGCGQTNAEDGCVWGGID